MEEESRTELEKLFRQDYLPLLSSFIISKKQAFPFLKNKGIYAVAVLSTKAEKKKIGIVPAAMRSSPGWCRCRAVLAALSCRKN